MAVLATFLCGELRQYKKLSDIMPPSKAVNDFKPSVEVYVDGGVREGTDVLKALALGAKMVFIGRPVLWGLAFDGKTGVDLTLEILRKELDLAMVLSGSTDVDSISRSLLKFAIPGNLWYVVLN